MSYEICRQKFAGIIISMACNPPEVVEEFQEEVGIVIVEFK